MPDFTARVIDILRTDRGGRWRTDAELAELIAAAAEDHYRPRIETVDELMSDPAVEAAQRASDGLDLDVELYKHQPVLSMRDGSVAGCQCMDRVFYVRNEDWGSHLAEVLKPHVEAAAREALKPIRELHKPRQRMNADYKFTDNYDCWHCGWQSGWPCATAKLVYTSEELER